MSTTAQVTAGSLATIITSTDLAFDVLTANSSTGAVTSSYLSSRAKSYLTSELLGLLTLDPTLSVAAAFQGLVQSLVSIDQLESNSYSISVAQVGARERKASPSRFAPASFRTLTKGRTKVVVACPRGHWSGKRCTVAMKVQTVLHSLTSPKCKRCKVPR